MSDRAPDPEAGQRPGPRGRPDSGSGADQLWWFRDAREPLPPPPSRWLRWPRRTHTVDAMACFSLSTLCFSQARSEMLFRPTFDFYHLTPLRAAALAAFVLNVVGLAAIGFLGVQWIRRVRRPAAQRLAAGAATVILLATLNFARMTHEAVGRWTDFIGWRGLLALVALALAAALIWPHPALRVVRGLAVAVSPLAVVTMVLALSMLFEVAVRPASRWVAPVPLDRTPPSLRRVVWIVFEELDQRITFEARPTGLELPEFDRLRRESLYAHAARPPAGTTDVAIPALITGRPVVAVEPMTPNELQLTFADGKTALWSAEPNVFSRARALGYDTALVGWSLPYSRILGGSLGAAHWRPSVTSRADAWRHARGGALASVGEPRAPDESPSAALREGGRAHPSGDPHRERRPLRPRLSPPAGSPATGHLRPGRGTLHGMERQRCGRGYFDNLALADRIIGDLRRGLDRARLDDRTWIVVTSTRSWQASTQYDGQTDSRVPFLVWSPEGGRTRHVDAAFGTQATHDLVLAILRGSISDASAAAAWLSRPAVASPRG